MSVPLNLAGLPGISVPVGETDAGLPVGLQLAGPRRSDRELLRFAGEMHKNSAAGSTERHVDIMGGKD